MIKNKFMMISLSVILTLVILLIPKNEVKAIEFEVDGKTFDTDVIIEEIQAYKSEATLSSYPYIMVRPSSTGFYLYMFTYRLNGCYDLNGIAQDGTFICSENSDYYIMAGLNSSSNYVFNGYNGYYFYSYNTSTDSVATLERRSGSGYNATLTSSNSINSYISNGGTIEDYFKENLIYTNFNFYLQQYDYIHHYGLTNASSNLEFNGILSTGEFSKIEFDFNIPDTPTSGGADLDLNLIVNALVGDNQSGFNFSSPYIEYTYRLVSVDESGMVTTSTKLYKDIVYVSDMTGYEYNYNSSKNIIPSELKDGDKYYVYAKLVVPLDSDFTQNININLTSNIEFEVTKYAKNEVDYSLTSLDLTNKKGAILVTKDIENTFTSNFKVNGYFYLEFRDSISDTNYNIEKTYSYGFCDLLLEDKENYNCSLSNKFSYYFGSDNPYRVLHFRNLNATDNTPSTIYYDSSKFDVYIIENDTDFIIIQDPVTGEDTIFDITIFENNSQSEVTVEYLVSLIEDFLKNNDNAWDLVKEVLELFFEYMPTEIYQALVLIMFVIFLCVIVMIAGWR